MGSLPQFQSDDRNFQLMQNSWGAALNPVIALSNAIGRIITATNSTGITLVTDTVKNLTSIQIPEGQWLVWGFVAFPSIPANATHTIGIISTSPSMISGEIYDGSINLNNQVPNNGSISQTVGPIAISLRNTTAYYLNAEAVFSGTAPTVKGKILAMQIGLN